MKFSKMHGLGNDYIYINNLNNWVDDFHDLAIRLSDRHFGIGGDGIILICQSKKADYGMRIFNSDGSEAEMCGNGIRCVGKYLYDKGITKKTRLSIETKSGIKKLVLYVHDGKVTTVQVDMGEVILKSSLIPVKNALEISTNNYKYFQVKIDEMVFTCVSMGNPHAVTFCNTILDFNVKKIGEKVENDVHFPKRTNVEFVEIIDKTKIKMRVWERGSGETMACGTGACASVVAAYLNGFTGKKVKVLLLKGELLIEWKANNHIYMTGPATHVFDGEI